MSFQQLSGLLYRKTPYSSVINRWARSLSTKEKFSHRNNKFTSANKKEDTIELPKFSTMVRQLYRRSHPDLLRASHGEFATINDQSMQVLNSMLTTIKVYNDYPPRIVQKIPFHMKTKGKDTLDLVTLDIRTSGGDSKKLITKTFESFFVKAGISEDGRFTWDKEYFPLVETSEE